MSLLPHTIDIVMGGQVNKVSALKYRPRQGRNRNGNCGKWEIRLSTDGAALLAVAIIEPAMCRIAFAACMLPEAAAWSRPVAATHSNASAHHKYFMH